MPARSSTAFTFQFNIDALLVSRAQNSLNQCITNLERMIVFRMGRTVFIINLSKLEREKLELMASRPKSSQRKALRARIILTCAEGKMNKDVAVELDITQQTGGKWRTRFGTNRLDGLVDASRSGHPRTISDQKVDEILTKTLEGTTKQRTHWSRRAMAKEVGVGQGTVGLLELSRTL
jgi:transposase